MTASTEIARLRAENSLLQAKLIAQEIAPKTEVAAAPRKVVTVVVNDPEVSAKYGPLAIKGDFGNKFVRHFPVATLEQAEAIVYGLLEHLEVFTPAE